MRGSIPTERGAGVKITLFLEVAELAIVPDTVSAR
jgi:hypothetical protein